MPAYDYRCGSCLREFEAIQPVIDRHQASCPMCACESFLIIKKVAPPVFGKGRSRESVTEWGRREKERLTKRSLDYDKTPRGKMARMESIERQAKRGNI